MTGRAIHTRVARLLGRKRCIGSCGLWRPKSAYRPGATVCRDCVKVRLLADDFMRDNPGLSFDDATAKARRVTDWMVDS